MRVSTTACVMSFLWSKCRRGLLAAIRRTRIVLLLAFAAPHIAFAQAAPPVAAVPDNGHIESLTVTGTRNAVRRLLIAVPPSFENADPRQVRVVYMLDGQGLFASLLGARGWGADASLWPLIAAGRAPPTLIVGIDAGTSRTRDYTPTRRFPFGGGNLPAFARDLIERVIPAVTERFHIAPGARRTMIAGGSLGGFAALQIGLAHPDVFGTIGAFSPALWWSRLPPALIDRDAATAARPRIWLSVGARERVRALAFVIDPIANLRRLHQRLAAKGWRDGDDLACRIFPNDRHNDASWRRQLPEFWQFALIDPETPDRRSIGGMIGVCG